MIKYFLVFVLLIVGCNKISEKYSYREIRDGQYIIMGKMSKDSVFNGEIKYYYDGKLSGIRNFTDGISNGKFINYFANGMPKAIGYDKNGLSEGEIVYFTNDGKRLRKYYFYKGRMMGPQYDYDSLGKISSFSFLNFEQQEICRLKYERDKIKIEEGKLYFHVFSEFAIDNSDKIKIFFYLIKPERIKVDYYIGYVTNGKNETFEQIEKVTSDNLFLVAFRTLCK